MQWEIFMLKMSHTFNQTMHGNNNSSMQNAGTMNHTVNNNHRDGDKIDISGKVGTIGSVGGSDIRNALYSQAPVENPTTTGI